MTANLGYSDRTFRLAGAFVLVALGLLLAEGTLLVLMLAAAVVLAATVATGFCPIYWLFRFSSRPRRHAT
jgi:hypothetical protein